MIRFGMALMEMIEQLTKGFVKATGRQPDNLEKLKIQQEAVQRFKDMNKVVDMEGNVIDTSKGIMGGRQIQENKELSQAIKEELMKKDNPYSDLVKTTEKGPKSLEQRRKEAEEALKNKNVTPIRESLEDFVDDAGGVNPDDPRGIDDFIPDPEDMAQGGRVGLMAGSVPKIFKLLKDPKKVKQAIDNIFPTGDVKYDATMAAESLVELNPKFFGNKLYDDLDSMTRLDIYDAVISPMMSAQAKALKMKKITKPEKTLQSMKEGKGINMSDPEIAKEFEQFMKQTDPEGVKKLEQTLELDNFDPKGRKKNAQGGRIGYADGTPDKKSLLDMIDVQASGFKSGKQQIPGAPKGITMDEESINAIIKADIPISQKIDLLADYQYGKGRTRIEKDDSEIFIDEGGFKNRNVGLGFNQDGEGISGSIMHNLETGDDDFKIRFLKRFANGGRIGLKAGMTKRAFLKLMGGVGAGIAGLKSGLLGIGKGAGKQVAEEVVKKSTSTPPAYFFELADKIKTLGRVTDGPAERIKIHSMPAKDGKSELMLTEDIGTGEMQIKKIGKEGDELTTEVQTMEYTPGSSQADEATQGIPADQYDEYTEFNSRIYKDEFNDPDIVEGIKVDEIIEEVKDQAPSIKKAGGGIARMLGE